jgi:TonB family protein
MLKLGLPSACLLLIAVSFSCSDAPKCLAPQEYLPSPDEFVPYDTPPVPLNEVEYEYPPEALEKGIEGTVWVKALIDTKGDVREAMIFKDSGTDVGFEEVALRGAFQVKYRPALYKGKPVAVWVVYPVHFSIRYKSK